jgi:hypothetical protein
MKETLHEAFLRGFGQSAGLKNDALATTMAYEDWLAGLGLQTGSVEAADLETEGWEAGYDAGMDYLENF